MRFPKQVVLDDDKAVAIGSGLRDQAELAERIAPHGVVRRAHAAIPIVDSGQGASVTNACTEVSSS